MSGTTVNCTKKKKKKKKKWLFQINENATSTMWDIVRILTRDAHSSILKNLVIQKTVIIKLAPKDTKGIVSFSN
jgi:hypothetical protein